MSFEVVSSENKYSGRVLALRVDRIRLENGKVTRLEVIEHRGSVVMVPVDADGGIWLVRQYRHAAGREILELPAGSLEAGEDPSVCAGRELREEIGMAAGRLTRIGGFFLAPGYSAEFMHVFLAGSLHPDRIPGDEDEVLRPEKISLMELRQRLEAGNLEDAKTVAALAIAMPRLAARI
ncbi:MAG TPA: NUDIX hydrolase [Anaerolineales bacterium]